MVISCHVTHVIHCYYNVLTSLPYLFLYTDIYTVIMFVLFFIKDKFLLFSVAPWSECTDSRYMGKGKMSLYYCKCQPTFFWRLSFIYILSLLSHTHIHTRAHATHTQVESNNYFDVARGNEVFSQTPVLLIVVGTFVLLLGIVGSVGGIVANTIVGRIILGLVNTTYWFINKCFIIFRSHVSINVFVI